MLTLKSIRIRNFRAIKELTFVPQEEGITGIFGPNGAGKSSILTAVMFALYGVRPKDITVGALRRTGSGTEECSVSVVFMHLGQTIEVIREISGKSNTVIANIYVDGEAETTTKPTAADKWIVKRLGIEAEGFLTAFVVRQKELDSFVRAVPAERKRIIEKLAGVETINKALKSAREDEKDSRKTVDVLPGSQEQVDASGEEVAYYTQQLEDNQSSLSSTEQTIQAVEEELNEYQNLILTHGNTSRELERVTLTLENLRKETPDLESQLERLNYVKEFSEGQSVESLREVHKQVSEKLKGYRNDYASSENQQNRLNQELNAAQPQLQAIEDELDQIINSLTWTEDEVEVKLLSLKSEQDINRNESIRLSTQNDDLEESIKLLEGESECPTCKTHLDDPQKLRTQLQAAVDNNNARKSELVSRNTELTDDVKEFQQIKERFSYQAELKQRKETIQESINAAQEALTALPDLSDLQQVIVETEAEQQRIVELGLKARSIDTDKKLYAELSERVDNNRLQVHQLTTTEQELKTQLSGVNLRDAEKRRSLLAEQHQTLNQNRNQLTNTIAEQNVRFENARNSYNKAYNQWEKKKGLQEAHEAKTLTTDMLDKFRQEVVSSIAPEISDYATTLISSMTDGHFTEIKLDEDFKASIINSAGEELSLPWLSGGEESAVALALRLAVSFLITGGNPDLLWLDEPLTAQDKDRRASILSMIRELPIQQILLINHAQEAQDIVDHEITLTKED